MDAKSKLTPNTDNHVPEIEPAQLKNILGSVTLIDVRGPDEFNGELSHIPGARLVTLGPELDAFFKNHDENDEIVFVCRSGARSSRATLQGLATGFTKSTNLRGGMLLWNELKYPTERGH